MALAIPIQALCIWTLNATTDADGLEHQYRLPEYAVREPTYKYTIFLSKFDI